MGQLTLILGGARSGKSTFAERLAAKWSEQVVYVATAEAKDEEMAARIAVHQQKRPSHWQTLELPLGIGAFVRTHPLSGDVVLLDCLTLLVTNVLLAANPDVEAIDEAACHAAVEREITALAAAIAASDAHWIVVSNEVGLGLVPPYPLGRVYRDTLGWANQQLARSATAVYFMLAGIPMRLQPEPNL
ncbi:MAG: bifunctional adenosylcobinamide kinase/adenosylcobinamide-phosphate guanylyltransferase [Anaerolineales bacterium]|nr:bifunctional adenosylcobinamide kinase/adenosylcobinamide-phosphate guanylyltransferase [Anaerolineales bacterium]